jgi:hypothetical protein
MASEAAGTALRSIYSRRSEDEIKMGPNFNQLNNQGASESCIPNMVAISKPQLTVTYLRGSEKSVLL